MAFGDFTHQASAYAQSRPTYPPQLLDRLIREFCPALFTPQGAKVADLGAGTGIFTQCLWERGFSVWAVEPNDAMREIAVSGPAHWVNGTFESTTLPTGSMDWVVAAQSFHWADPARALPEIHRILKPGGFFTALWNERQTEASPILRLTESLLKHLVPDFAEAYQDCLWDQILESTGDFVFSGIHREAHTVTMSAERFLSLWKSHNRLGNIAGPEKLNQFLGELQMALKGHQGDPLEIPYLCSAWTAKRREYQKVY